MTAKIFDGCLDAFFVIVSRKSDGHVAGGGGDHRARTRPHTLAWEKERDIHSSENQTQRTRKAAIPDNGFVPSSKRFPEMKREPHDGKQDSAKVNRHAKNEKQEAKEKKRNLSFEACAFVR
jgi:hypothetical protein